MNDQAKIFFLYTDGDYDLYDTTLSKAEEEIKYWLGKSPGTHDIEEIYVVPVEHLNSLVLGFGKGTERRSGLC